MRTTSDGNGADGLTPDQIIDLLKSGGAVIGAIYLLVKVIDFLRFVLSGIKESIDATAKAVDKATDALVSMKNNQVEHDKQLNAIMDTQTVTADGLKDQNTILSDQTHILYDIKTETTATGNRMQTLHAGIIDGLNDHSTALGAMTDTVIARIDKLPGEILTEFDEPLAKIQADLSKLIDPNLAMKIAEGLQPGLVALVEKVLIDCLKQNDALAKELNTVEPLAVNIIPPDSETPTEPDPPTNPSPDHKAAIPGDFEPLATLPRTGTEG